MFTGLHWTDREVFEEAIGGDLDLGADVRSAFGKRKKKIGLNTVALNLMNRRINLSYVTRGDERARRQNQ